ncbi:MAG: YdbL family protein [Opitutales bacterium]|nr:YdbL family protein [Opitutales bacterium]
MKTLLKFITILVASACLVSAENPTEIQKRMADRLPAIVELKTQNIVGENNEALLSILGQTNESNAQIVQQENADRKTIYNLLAKQTGAPVHLVQSKRAAQLRAQAAAGTMVQTEAGEWIKKS